MGQRCSQSDKHNLDADIIRLQATPRSATPSKLLGLHCISPRELNCKPQVHELQSALEVLEMVAMQMGLSHAAAPLLQMEFAKAIIAHEHTMKQAGICDQTLFNVLGYGEARAQAQVVDIWLAAKEGNVLYVEDVQLVCVFASERVNAEDRHEATPLDWAVKANPSGVVTTGLHSCRFTTFYPG